MNDTPRVVFDTNILFSSVGWLGSPHHCVQAARQGRCLSLTSEAILAEFTEKLQLKRGFDSAKATEAADEIRSFSRTIITSGTLRVIADDPDDDAVLECAVAGQADYLVSGDRHLLALSRYQNIQIIRAADFLALLHSKPGSR